MKKLLTSLVAIWLAAASGFSQAAFHLWQIEEVFSNADGSVQFVELTALSGGQQFLIGQSITAIQGSNNRSFTFPSNLPGDSSGKSFLVGTQGFAALNIVQPDYVVPNGFFFSSGSINFAGADILVYNALPASPASFGRGGINATNSPRNFAGATGTVPASTVLAAADYADLWWGGTTENGWGMTVQQHGNTQFNIFFVYDNTGKPVWYAMPGCTWNANFTTCTGQLAKPRSAPLNNYNPAQFVPGGAVGTIAVTYTSASTATVNYTIDGISATKSMQRQLFGPVDNTAGLKVGDMWWGGTAQNGWGVSITQQFRTLFAAWFTYDQAGNVTWYTLPGGTWNGNTYSGTLATATSSPWLGVNYNPAQFAPTAAGTVSFAFSDANNATMSYTITSGPFAGTTQTKQLVRQPF